MSQNFQFVRKVKLSMSTSYENKLKLRSLATTYYRLPWLPSNSLEKKDRRSDCIILELPMSSSSL